MQIAAMIKIGPFFVVSAFIICHLTVFADGFYISDEMKQPDILADGEQPDQIILLANNDDITEVEPLPSPSSSEEYWNRIFDQIQGRREKKGYNDRLQRRASHSKACLFKLCPHIY